MLLRFMQIHKIFASVSKNIAKLYKWGLIFDLAPTSPKAASMYLFLANTS